jgi:hypothetical protein
MTYYLADFDIRDGDNEYKFQFLYQFDLATPYMTVDLDKLRAGSPIYDSIRWNWYYNYGVDRSKWDEKWEELDLFSRIIRRGNLP